MGLKYENLDEETRKYMIQEMDLDEKENKIYNSTRFNENGHSLWRSLLRDGIQKYDDDWIAEQLKCKNCFKEYEEKNRNGKVFSAKVPVTAANTLAEGEFNRFYARGICLRAINEGTSEVQVYRGKAVMNPRSQSELLIGRKIDAKELLKDLRNSQGVEPALGIPPGPNSGLTIRLIK